MKVSIFKRSFKAYLTVAKTFGAWFSPIITVLLIIVLKIIRSSFMIIDYIIFPKIWKKKIVKPIMIIGNPRSGTTFLHRYLVARGIGTGSQLWQMIYTSITLQLILKPLLPFLEKISPTRHHSTDAHKTSLSSTETDDASLLFRFFDGFFLYGFILSWSDEELFDWFDPKIRDTSKRDYGWLESMWKRILISNNEERIIGKLFSVSTNVPKFLEKFPDAKLLYMLRDPMSVIPSGLSLVTGVLDKKFGFWTLPNKKRQLFINRLYKALIELQIRFHDDWVNNKIDKEKVMIVRFNIMMDDFEGLMKDILKFIDIDPDDNMLEHIKNTAENQRNYKSNHKYDLSKFGITEEQIRIDCKKIYDTFM